MDWGQNEQPSPLATFQLRTVAGIDPRISLEFTTLALRVGKSLEREQLMASLSAIFGGLALTLAAIGLYGTMAHRVARRRNEIGLRIALGAHPEQIRRRVLAEATGMILVGLAGGMAATLAVSRFLASFLYGLAPNDPLTLAITAAVLFGTGLAAAYLPAHCASGIDPISALRRE
jgi:putative ABC transport system permease protein